VALTSLLML